MTLLGIAKAQPKGNYFGGSGNSALKLETADTHASISGIASSKVDGESLLVRDARFPREIFKVPFEKPVVIRDSEWIVSGGIHSIGIPDRAPTDLHYRQSRDRQLPVGWPT